MVNVETASTKPEGKGPGEPLSQTAQVSPRAGLAQPHAPLEGVQVTVLLKR